MTDIPDLAAALTATIAAAREQRERDNLPCPKCGGDRLRGDFTGSGLCHVPKAQSRRTAQDAVALLDVIAPDDAEVLREYLGGGLDGV